MPMIIRNPKDGVDQLLEQSRAVQNVLGQKPQSVARDDALLAMRAADEALTRARAAVIRIYERRPVVPR